jgi:N,N'-diacetyllegionaminate synthase
MVISSFRQNPIFGEKLPCFIIAEAGVNHNGSLDTAYQLVDAAKAARVDAVKFQTFITDKFVTSSAPKAGYQKTQTAETETQEQMLRHLELDFDSFRKLFTYCRQQHIVFLSTPFDETSADFLETLGVIAFKVGSGDITNLPFLSHIARKKKPMIVSTGMSCLGEVETALQSIRQAGDPPIALLHCTSNYPTEPKNVNLRAMQTLRMAFGVATGYSDHTMGIEIALAAVALGANVLEKHFTLDRNLPGPDHQASLEPDELSALVRGARKVESAMGDGRKLPVASEQEVAAIARKSLVIVRDMRSGETIVDADIVVKRPGTGLAPIMLPYILGRRLRMDVPAGTVLRMDMLV